MRLPVPGRAARRTPRLHLVATEARAFLARQPLALAVFERVRAILDPYDQVEVRTSKSQVVFGLRRGFAYLWLPRQYLAEPRSEVVLSIVLGRHDDSPRFKQVVHPTRAHWMHHLEVHDLETVDDEVAGWLREAADRAD